MICPTLGVFLSLKRSRCSFNIFLPDERITYPSSLSLEHLKRHWCSCCCCWNCLGGFVLKCWRCAPSSLTRTHQGQETPPISLFHLAALRHHTLMNPSLQTSKIHPPLLHWPVWNFLTFTFHSFIFCFQASINFVSPPFFLPSNNISISYLPWQRDHSVLAD